MSDWEGDRSATAVVEPPADQGPPPTRNAASTPPPPAGPGRGRVPWWVAVLAAAVAAVAVGGAVFFFVSSGSTDLGKRLDDLTKSNAELEKRAADLAAQIAAAEASAAAGPAKSAVTTAPAAPATAKPEKQFTFITKVTWDASKGYMLTADYAQFLTGKAAADAATAHGDESPPPNDFYIVNDSKKLRTFPVAKSVTVVVLGWGGTDATAKATIPIGQFMDVMPGGVNPQPQWSQAPYYITIVGGTVTRVDQVYIP